LVKKELTMDEAASVTCDPKEDIVKFVLDELDQVIPDLPKTVKEHGRVVRGAAYAVKGRLLMSEERWAEAANTYKNLMDMDVHSIDPDYKELFDGRKEESNEIIFTSKYLWARIDNGTQNTCRPHLYMGLNQYAATKDLVDSYLCKDGEPIEECEHYQNADPGIFKEEFVTDQGERYRDPRLYQTLYIPQIHEIDGQLYKAHPDSVSNGDEPFGEDLGKTGYALRKYVAEWYEGAIYDGGNDIPIIRYAEVLLSRLESEIKAGNEIDQDLLDKTINKVRTRESVDLPPVNYNDYNGPMDLWENCVKRERRVELAFEGGIRYWDLVRWDEDVERLKNRTTYGIKVAEEPSESNYPDRLTDEGYAIIYTYSYKEHFHPWPIPQDELDINPNLEQKDNWK